MNSRNRLMLLILGVVVLGGLLAAGWFFLAAPYLVRLKNVEKAEREAREAEETRDDLEFQSKKLQQLLPKSLPAGPEYKDDPKRQKREYAEVAKQEYEQALVKLLKDAGVRSSTVNYVDGESNNKAGIPQLDKEFKPDRNSDPIDYLSYIPVVFKIDIPKTDLGTLAELLRRYYTLDLLQQITHLNIKHTGTNDLGEDKRSEKERNDLKVEIITRAIIVNNAPRRRTLTHAPDTIIALMGAGAAAVYENSPALGRKAPAEPLESLLAGGRDYRGLITRDAFHGPLYDPPPPKDPGPTIVTEAPPKPDFREFIWFTTSIESSRGDEHTVDIIIKDKINQDEYHVSVTQEGEKVSARTTKFVFENHKSDPSERKKRERGYDSKVLDISRYTMSNKNEFTIYGVDIDGALILGEKPSGLSADLPKEEKAPQPNRVGGRPGFGGGSPKVTLPAPDPKAAVVGGLVVTAPKAEKFYRWEYGKNLKQIVELSKPEADKAIRRAQTRFLPSTSGTAAAEAAAPVASDSAK